MTQLGWRLRAYRLEAGLSQAELARRANSDRAYICGLEKGYRLSPTPDSLRRIVTALGGDEHCYRDLAVSCVFDQEHRARQRYGVEFLQMQAVIA